MYDEIITINIYQNFIHIYNYYNKVRVKIEENITLIYNNTNV